jgi:hypothetical protein
MNNDFTPWIRPTLKGPFLTSWAFTTLSFGLASLGLGGGVSALTFGQADDWLVAMLLVSFFAGLVVASLVASDLVLLRLKLRKLPTGLSAWTSSLFAPVAIWLAWSFFGFGDGDSVFTTVAHIAAPIAGAPFALRLLLGSKP